MQAVVDFAFSYLLSEFCVHLERKTHEPRYPRRLKIRTAQAHRNQDEMISSVHSSPQDQFWFNWRSDKRKHLLLCLVLFRRSSVILQETLQKTSDYFYEWEGTGTQETFKCWILLLEHLDWTERNGRIPKHLVGLWWRTHCTLKLV